MNLLDRIFASRSQQKHGFILALGGGGGRGLAHLGVLAALERAGLRPDAIVGSSIGSMFGAMYAMHPDAGYVIKRAAEILQSERFTQLELPIIDEVETQDQSWLSRLNAAARQTLFYTRAATGRSIADTDALIEIASTFCGGESFADAEIPIYATAVEFPNGECHLFSADSGVSLPCAVAASMAIPGVFEPVKIGGKQYVDGGVASDLPAKEARMLAADDQLVLAVNVGARPRAGVEPTNVYGMLDWSTQIKSFYLRKYDKTFADLLIEPMVGFTQWHDFSNPEQEIEKGRVAAAEQIPALLERLGR